MLPCFPPLKIPTFSAQSFARKQRWWRCGFTVAGRAFGVEGDDAMAARVANITCAVRVVREGYPARQSLGWYEGGPAGSL